MGTEYAVEFLALRFDLVGHDRHQRLCVRQDDAVFQELRTGRATERRLVRPALVERGDLRAFLDAVELAFGDVPANRENLAALVQALDRPVGVLGADVDVLDELHVRVGGNEGTVGVVGRAGFVADVQPVLLGSDELGVRNGGGDEIIVKPFIRPWAQNSSGRRRTPRTP